MASDLSSNPAVAAAGSPAPGGPAAAIPLDYQEAPKPKSAWSPLAVPIFRALWIAYLVSLIGTWAREAGGPWLMGILTDKQKDSALWVSLIQTASNLPIAFLSIAAGVMADIYDRRRLLIWTNVWMLVASAALAVMTITGHINRESLLIMTLVLGAGAAMAGPAFQYVIPELVPPSELPLAIALNSVALNIARAIGPALAGIVLAVAAHWLAPVQATGLSFVINAVAFVGVIWVLVRWKRAPQKQLVHRETLGGAAMTAFRYTAHSPALRAILIRVAAFILCAVIVWAQLAIIAKQQLKGGEVVYTIMMACVGFGAVIGVFFMPKMDKRFSTDGMVSICTVAFGLALVGLSQCKGAFANVWLAGALAAVVGFNWVIVPTNFNIATQRSVPGWVKGRAIAMYMTVLFGSFAVGSPIWGKVSTAVGISNASFIAGCLVALGSLLAIPFPLTRAKGHDFGPANRPAPTDAPPGPADLEMVLAYPVERARAAEFERVMHGDVRPQRLRNGATRWVLAPRKAGSESANGTVLYEEVFAFTSWSDRLRFHARTTKADAAAEEEALKFVVGPQPAPVYRPAVLGTTPMVSGRRMASPPPLINWDFLATRFLEELGTMVNRMMGERPEPRDRRGRKR